METLDDLDAFAAAATDPGTLCRTVPCGSDGRCTGAYISERGVVTTMPLYTSTMDSRSKVCLPALRRVARAAGPVTPVAAIGGSKVASVAVASTSDDLPITSLQAGLLGALSALATVHAGGCHLGGRPPRGTWQRSVADIFYDTGRGAPLGVASSSHQWVFTGYSDIKPQVEGREDAEVKADLEALLLSQGWIPKVFKPGTTALDTMSKMVASWGGSTFPTRGSVLVDLTRFSPRPPPVAPPIEGLVVTVPPGAI